MAHPTQEAAITRHGPPALFLLLAGCASPIDVRIIDGDCIVESTLLLQCEPRTDGLSWMVDPDGRCVEAACILNGNHPKGYTGGWSECGDADWGLPVCP